jgi:lipopolysaccharide export system permease protein
MASVQTASTKTAARKKRRKDGPLKIVDGYLLLHVMEGTLRGLLWFGGLLFMVTAVSALKSVLADQLSISSLVNQVLFQVPRIILFALPMSVLYGTTQAFTELSTESEITALWASGVSMPRMMLPALMWSIMLAIIAFLLQELVVPKSQLNMEAIKRAAFESSGRGGFRYDDPPRGKGPLKTVIQAKALDAETGTLIKPTITIYDVEKQLPEVVIRAEKGQWDLETNKWRLYNGSTTRFGLNPETGAWIPRNTSKFNVAMNRHTPDLAKLANSNISARAAMDKPDFEFVSLRDLLPYRAETYDNMVRAEGTAEGAELFKKVRSLTFGIHDKIATPLLCLALVIVGAPLGIRPPRAKGQSGVALGMSLVVLTVYYITWTWCSKLGEAGVGNPLLLAYLSPILILAAGLYLLAQKSR